MKNNFDIVSENAFSNAVGFVLPRRTGVPALNIEPTAAPVIEPDSLSDSTISKVGEGMSTAKKIGIGVGITAVIGLVFYGVTKMTKAKVATPKLGMEH